MNPNVTLVRSRNCDRKVCYTSSSHFTVNCIWNGSVQLLMSDSWSESDHPQPRCPPSLSVELFDINKLSLTVCVCTWGCSSPWGLWVQSMTMDFQSLVALTDQRSGNEVCELLIQAAIQQTRKKHWHKARPN